MWLMCFVSVNENRRMKTVECSKNGGSEEEGEWWKGVNLTYIVSTYVNITMYPLCNYYMLIIFF
jgi:hypothetical protein